MAEIILKNVYKVFDGGVVAVSDFNIWIKDKEFIVLVGPSGCGKSTTLRMVAGLDDITEGSIYIDGVLVNNVPPKDRDIAMVFQDYALYPHMTVYDNIGYGLRLRKFPKRVIDEKVREAAKILAIEDLLKRKPKALSGGQRQRVAIGRAIVRSPKVFLMDEPLSNLDAKLRNQMRAELIKLREKLQTTFIYVTHDQTEAMTLGDRIVIMKDGFVQQIGTPREVFSSPANIFVAGFIGMPQMNFFDGKLEKRGGEYYVYAGNKELMLSSDRRRNFDEKGIQPGDVTVGIRPEHVHVSEKEGPLSGTVEVVEMMGSSMHIHFNYDGKMTIALAGDKDVAIEHFRHGSTVFFDFDEENIHLFGHDGANLEYVPEIEEIPEEILPGKNVEIDEDEAFAEEKVLNELLEAEALSKGDDIESEKKEKTSFMDFIMNKKK